MEKHSFSRRVNPTIGAQGTFSKIFPSLILLFFNDLFSLSSNPNNFSFILREERRRFRKQKMEGFVEYFFSLCKNVFEYLGIFLNFFLERSQLYFSIHWGKVIFEGIQVRM